MKYIHLFFIITSLSTLIPPIYILINTFIAKYESKLMDYIQSTVKTTLISSFGETYISKPNHQNLLCDLDMMLIGISLLNDTIKYLNSSIDIYYNYFNNNNYLPQCILLNGPYMNINHQNMELNKYKNGFEDKTNVDRSDNDIHHIDNDFTEHNNYSSKPILIQTTYLSCKYHKNYKYWIKYNDTMFKILNYYEEYYHGKDSLYSWTDMREAGFDSIFISTCPYKDLDCWNDDLYLHALSTPDILTYMYREYKSYQLFLGKWASEGISINQSLSDSINSKLSNISARISESFDTNFGFRAYNITSGEYINKKTILLGFPLLTDNLTHTITSSINYLLNRDDMLSDNGIRSISNIYNEYNNDNYNNRNISNYNGPIYVYLNVLLIYGLQSNDYISDANKISDLLLNLLIRNYHIYDKLGECYSSDDGISIGVPNYISYNALIYNISNFLKSGKKDNPFSLQYI